MLLSGSLAIQRRKEMGKCKKEKWDVKMFKKYFLLFKRKKPVAICTPRTSKKEESCFSVCCGFDSFDSGSLSLWTFKAEPVARDVTKVQSPQRGPLGMARSSLCLL